MTSEIIEEEKDDEKKRIRQIIEYQKSLYWSSYSSSSFSSSIASSTSSTLCNKSGRLLDLMKSGNTSLRRLFEMEHTTLATHFQDYCCSSITKTIPLWGSETDDEIHDPWAAMKRIGGLEDFGNDELSNYASDGSFMDGEFGFRDKRVSTRRKLTRKKSFRRLPRFPFWRFRRFRFRLRLKRLRIKICGKKF